MTIRVVSRKSAQRKFRMISLVEGNFTFQLWGRQILK